MSNYPIEQLHNKKVVLTEDSATSALLVRLILAEHKVAPVFVTGKMRRLEDIPDDADAVLVIGDAALTQPWDDSFDLRMDLGELWYQKTGMPFVFAVWVVRRDYAAHHPEQVAAALDLFLRSRDQGYENLGTVIDRGVARLNLDRCLIERYYQVLLCDLDQPKIHALELFFQRLYRHGLFNEQVKVELFQPWGHAT